MSGAQVFADNDYPRLLFVTWEALNDRSATGVSFGSLLEGWPLNRLAQVYGTPHGPNPTWCRQSWEMSLDQVPIVKQLRKLRPRRQPRATDGVPAGLGSEGSSREDILAWLDLIPFSLSSQFLDWVDGFRPEVIFSNTGSLRWARLARVLAARYRVPLVPYFNDDWPTTHYAKSRATWLPRARLLAELSAVLSRAKVGMAGSFLMAEEYSSRFGLPFHPFMHCVPVSEEIHPPRPTGDKFRFTYVGGLHLNRWKSLRRVNHALSSIQPASGAAELVIHAPEAELNLYAKELSGGVSRMAGSLASKDVPTALRDSDVLVLVESFDEDMRRYSRLSLSTKVPLYLAAGRPILAFGPGEVSSMRYVDQCGAGLVVGKDDEKMLAVTAQSLLSDGALRARLSESGWQTALANHVSAVQQDKFRRLLQQVAGQGKPER